MTDLISAPGAATDGLGDDKAPTSVLPPFDAPTDTVPPITGETPVEWAPIEPRPKKRRLGLWIGLGLGAVALGAGAASMILIAPGTTVAGIPVGFMTPGAAAETITTHLAQTEVTLTGPGEGAVVSGSDLGISIAATDLANQAFADHPLWNLGSWMGDPIPADITLDPETATSALRAAVPSSFDDAVDAGVTFDDATGTYLTTPSADGTGIDVADLTAAITSTVATGGTSLEYPGGPVTALPAVSDDDAAATAASLNTMLGTIGFYVGDERTVPVKPKVAASWLSVEAVDGELQIIADSTQIQAVVDTLAESVNRESEPAKNIVDSDGNVLRTETEGATGRELADTTGMATEFAAALEKGDAAYPLTVTETPFETTEVTRSLTVDISDQRTYLIENGKVVKSWLVSTGLPGTPTDLGHFRVRAHVPIQDMRGTNADGSTYVTKDVPWVLYFNGDEAFHGTWWHSNFGNRMSHGCVNMTFDAAKQVYDASPLGLEVWVRE